jgi:hypothetical protein
MIAASTLRAAQDRPDPTPYRRMIWMTFGEILASI